jgi:hypothetical protein
VKLPSHNTVIAYLALFVALGGTAFAATQLPKNSVGTKQLKANAVTTAKIKSGAVNGTKIATNSVTGANVDESTLGRVPSAGSAETAATAGHANTATNAGHAGTAGNASTLGGVPSSGFLQAKSVYFGTSALNVTYEAQIVEVPGWFSIKTQIGPYGEHRFNVTNLSSQTWAFLADGSSIELGPGSTNGMSFGTDPVAEIFAVSKTERNDHALIDCGFESAVVSHISCSVRIPPAA